MINYLKYDFESINGRNKIKKKKTQIIRLYVQIKISRLAL
jgi:hypothetical protein